MTTPHTFRNQNGCLPTLSCQSLHYIRKTSNITFEKLITATFYSVLSSILYFVVFYIKVFENLLRHAYFPGIVQKLFGENSNVKKAGVSYLILRWLMYCNWWIAGKICINDFRCRVPESRVWESSWGSGCHPLRGENLIMKFTLSCLIIHAYFFLKHEVQVWC